MRLNTFYQICIYITIAGILFTLSVNFVSGLGVFEYTGESGIQTGENVNSSVAAFTTSNDYQDGFVMDNLWAVVLAGIAGGLVVAWLTHSTSVIGVYIFAFVFWSSYTNIVSMLYNNNFLGELWGFIVIGTVGITFVFIGAVAGMLSGSG